DGPGLGGVHRRPTRATLEPVRFDRVEDRERIGAPTLRGRRHDGATRPLSTTVAAGEVGGGTIPLTGLRSTRTLVCRALRLWEVRSPAAGCRRGLGRVLLLLPGGRAPMAVGPSRVDEPTGARLLACASVRVEGAGGAAGGGGGGRGRRGGAR